ncbi:MAG: outer membrane protein assembly factor BamC [Gammaproteobacteria bacterium]|nr:outer membrane protein assembly factor BamC [Gammaproteobacteria bacterium]
MRLSRKAMVVALAVVLAGCSSVEEKRQAYKGAQAEAPLEVPPRLTLPPQQDALKIPEKAPAPAEAVAAKVADAKAVDLSGVTLQRDGAVLWLQVKDEPKVVWARVQRYFADYGPAVKETQPNLMILDTDWHEPGAEQPSANVFKKVFSNLFAKAVQVKYRVRLEPGTEPGTTALFLGQQRMQQVAVEETVRWMPAETDRELEAETLKRLMVFLGADEATAQEQLFKVTDAHYEIVHQQGRTVMLIRAPKEWAYRRVGQALDRAAINVTESQPAASRYRVNYPVVVGTREEGTFLTTTKNVTQDRELVLSLEEGKLVVLMSDGQPVEDSVAAQVLNRLLEFIK